MARRGRFARATGGSDISSLISQLIQQQATRRYNAMYAAFKNGTTFEGSTPTASQVMAYLGSVADILGYDSTTLASEQNNILITGATNAASAAASAYSADRGNAVKYQDYINAKRALLAFYTPGSDNYNSTQADIDSAASTFVNDSAKLLESGAITVDQYKNASLNALSGISGDQLDVATDNYLKNLYNYEQKFEQAKLNKTKNYAAYSKWLAGWLKIYENAGLQSSSTYATLKGDLARTNEAGSNAAAQTAVTDGVASMQAGIGQIDAFYGLVAETLGIDPKTVSAADVARFYAIAQATPSLTKYSTFISRTDLANLTNGLRSTSLGITSSAASGKVTLGQGVIDLQNAVINLAESYGLDTLGDRANVITGEYLNDNFAANNGVTDEHEADKAYLRKLQAIIAAYKAKENLTATENDLLLGLEADAAAISGALSGQMPPTGAVVLTVSGEEIDLNGIHSNAEVTKQINDGKAVQAYDNSTGQFITSSEPGALVLTTGNGTVQQGNGGYYALTYRTVNGKNQRVAVKGDAVRDANGQVVFVYVRSGSGGDTILYGIDGKTVFFGDQADTVITASGGLVGSSEGGFVFRGGLNLGGAIPASNPIIDSRTGEIAAFESPTMAKTYAGYDTVTENNGIRAGLDAQAAAEAAKPPLVTIGPANYMTDLIGAVFLKPFENLWTGLDNTVRLTGEVLFGEGGLIKNGPKDVTPIGPAPIVFIPPKPPAPGTVNLGTTNLFDIPPMPTGTIGIGTGYNLTTGLGTNNLPPVPTNTMINTASLTTAPSPAPVFGPDGKRRNV